MPRNLLDVDGVLYFSATSARADASSPQDELWRSDGTEEGTYAVKKTGFGRLGVMSGVIAAGRKLFFTVSLGQLWVSEGTEESTLHIPWIGTSIAALAAYRDVLYFAGDDAAHGRELWRSDGTAAGTQLVADLVEGRANGVLDIYPTPNGLFVVTAVGFPETGSEPWIIDGSPGGTRMLVDLNPGPLDSNPRDFVAAGDKTIFSAIRGYGVRTLWSTEGTAESTILLGEISPHGLISAGDYAFFFATDGETGLEPWRSDGTPEGTYRIADLNPGPEPSWTWTSSDCDRLRICPASAVAIDGIVYFLAAVGEMNGLWRTDGTEEGTYFVSPLEIEFNPRTPPKLIAAGDRVFLAPLWSSDGTGAGTLLLLDDPEVENLTAVGDGVFFSKRDSQHGRELWHSDGTSEGTRLVRDIRSSANSSDPAPIGIVGNKLVFEADSGARWRELWTSDGTEAGTQLLRDLRNSGSPLVNPTISAVNAGGVLYFCIDDGEHGKELWRTDGTRTGTRIVLDISPGKDASSPDELIELDGKVYFVASQKVDEGRVYALWRSDGTPEGTRSVFVFPERRSPFRAELEVLRGSLYFSLPDRGGLWRMDGTDETVEFLPLEGLTTITKLSAFGDLMVFSAVGPVGREPYRTDGTPGGTWLLRDITDATVGGDSSPSDFVRAGDQIFFTARSMLLNRRDLWRTDGTAEGTQLVTTLELFLPQLTVVGDQIAAVGSSFAPIIGNELLLIDADGGSTAFDIRDGLPSSSPQLLGVVGDTLLFAADDGVHGRELWRERNGRAELLDDIAADRLSSNPSNMMRVGGHIFFSAEEPSLGTELWAIDVSDAIGTTPCVGDCDYDGVVTVDELLAGITVALGGTEQVACDAFDRDANHATTVDEVIDAVNNALTGCGS